MIWKAIWNGPFYVGKLEQPISMGAAFLKVLETLWRAAICFLIGIAVLLGAILVWSHWDNKRGEREARNVRAAIQVGAERCGDTWPIMVTFDNRNKRAVTYLSFSIKAFVGDSGVDVATADDRYETINQPIPPASTLWMCRKAPDATIGKPSRFSVKVEHVTLED